MAVGFKLTPSSAAASAVFVEQQNVRRGVGSTLPHRILLIGQYNSGYTVTDDTPQFLLSAADAMDRYGPGSMLHRMAVKAFASGGLGYEVYALPVADDVSAVDASGDITITGSATAAGTLALTIAGEEVDVAVSSGDSATDVGDAVEAAGNQCRPDPSCHGGEYRRNRRGNSSQWWGSGQRDKHGHQPRGT